MSNEELIRMYRDTQDEEIINTIINKNYGLITSFLKNRFPGKCYDKDYIQEGVIGILTALNKFDLEKNIKFSTYATIWIKQKIFRYYRSDKLIKIPEYIQNKVEDFDIVGYDCVHNYYADCDDLLLQHDMLDVIYSELDKIEPISKLIFNELSVKGNNVCNVCKIVKKSNDEVIGINEKIIKILRNKLKEKGYNKEEIC